MNLGCAVGSLGASEDSDDGAARFVTRRRRVSDTSPFLERSSNGTAQYTRSRAALQARFALADRRGLLNVEAVQASRGYGALRIRIASSRWRDLKARAAGRRSTPGQYADLILSYPAHDRPVMPAVRAMDDPDEEIYVDLEIETRLRGWLAARSQEYQLSLATYAGHLLTSFLTRYETDPRDLRMMRFLTARLQETPMLSEEDLIAAIGHCEMNSRVRLPPGYLAKWLHGRLQPVVGTFERDGQPVAVSVEVVDELLSRGGASA